MSPKEDQNGAFNGIFEIKSLISDVCRPAIDRFQAEIRSAAMRIRFSIVRYLATASSKAP